MRTRAGFLRLVAVVGRRDYLRTVRRRGFIIGTLLLPLGLGLLFIVSSLVSVNGATTGPAVRDVTLVVVDQSSQAIVPPPALAANIRMTGLAEAEASLARAVAQEYYLVPRTWPTDPKVVRVEAPQHGLGIEDSQRRAVQAQLLEALLRTSLLADVSLPPQTTIRVLAPMALESRTTTGEPVSDAAVAASFLVPYAFTLLFVMSIFITSGYLLQSVTEEKENRVVEIVLSSIPSLPLMAGKILGLGAAGLTQVLIWLTTAIVAIPIVSSRVGGLGDVHISAAVVVLGVVYFVLGYLSFGAIFAAIGALAPGNREAQQYSGFFGFFAVIPLIFASVIVTDPGSPIVWLLALIPLTAPATMLQVLTLSDSLPAGMIAASLLSLTIFVALATVASARIFRATLLLYGMRPSLHSIMDAVLDRG